MVLLTVGHADENPPACGKDRSGGNLALGKGDREPLADAHDLAGRFHLRAEDDIDSGELHEREDRLLDGNVAGIGARV